MAEPLAPTPSVRSSLPGARYDAPVVGQKRSPLHERHVALGAKFAPFGGWEMPLEYAGGGVLKEHAAVREAVGVFDVSHLGTVMVQGTGTVDFLNARLTNDLDRIGAGQAQYTLVCNDAGGVVDDLIAYRFGERASRTTQSSADDQVLLIPNAANAAQVVRLLSEGLPDGVTVSDQHAAWAIVAVQGPRSPDLLAALSLPVDHPYLSFVTASWRDVPVVVLRTGYTGAHGYELLIPAQQAGVVWDAVLAAGQEHGARPCGLAARDTLRTEMGYPLHGQELSPSITPLEAGLGWAVGWAKREFWGREALVAQKAAGPTRRLWGLTALDKGIPRPHMAALADDTVVGEVTSGTFSPSLRTGIALALIDTSSGLKEGDEIAVDVRGRRTPMRVVRPPFLPPAVRS